MNKTLKSIIKIIFSIAVVALVGYFFVKAFNFNVKAIDFSLLKPNYPKLFLSTLVLLVSQLYIVAIWTLMLKQSGYCLSFKRGWEIFFISNLGRYLPGKIWQQISMVYMVKTEGINSTSCISSIILHQLIIIATGLLAMVVFSFDYINENYPFMLYIIPVCVLLLSPFFVKPVAKFTFNKILKREFEFSYTSKNYMLWLVLMFFSWIGYGGAFSLFLDSIYGNKMSLFDATGFFASGYTLGYAAFMVPGGIGVREGDFFFSIKGYPWN